MRPVTRRQRSPATHSTYSYTAAVSPRRRSSSRSRNSSTTGTAASTTPPPSHSSHSASSLLQRIHRFIPHRARPNTNESFSAHSDVHPASIIPKKHAHSSSFFSPRLHLLRIFLLALVLFGFVIYFVPSLFYHLSSPVVEDYLNQIPLPPTLHDVLMMGFSDRPGVQMRAEGWRAHHPVVLLPGVIATGLEVWEGEECAKHQFRQRLWGSSNMVRALLLDSTCWLRHVLLDPDTGLDPPNIKLRPALGFDAADFFIGNFWIFSKLIENLADISYDPNSFAMMAYDWRLATKDLQVRDRYYSKMKSTIEILYEANNGIPTVLIAHSMGGLVGHYFLQWVSHENPTWVDKYIHSFITVGTPFLGVPKAFSALFSGEMKDTADFAIAPFLDSWRQTVLFSQGDLIQIMRSMPSIPSMLPKGGDVIWGDQEGAPDDVDPFHYDHFAMKQIEKDPDDKRDFTIARVLSANSTDTPPPAVDPNELTIRYESKKGTGRGLFITFQIDNSTLLHEELLLSSQTTIEDSLGFLRQMAPKFMKRVDSTYSMGWEQLKQLQRNRRDGHSVYSDIHPTTWSNPLESPLPNAPKMKIYCLYGVGRETERGYVYKHHIGSPPLLSNKNNTNPPPAEPTPVPDSYLPRFTLSTFSTDDFNSIRNGVKLTDGDGTVPLVSLGFLSRGAWRGKTLLNPSGMKIVTREYMEVNQNSSIPLLRSPWSSDHVDIIGNHQLLQDIIKIVGKNIIKDSKEESPELVGDRIYSSIERVSERVISNFLKQGIELQGTK